MKRFKKILIDLSQNDIAHVELRRFFDLAKKNEAELTLFCAIEDTPEYSFTDQLMSNTWLQYKTVTVDQVRSSLEKRAADLNEEFVKTNIEVMVGRLGLSTVETAVRGGHDLIILPSGALYDDSFDSLANQKILRKAPCPVWIGSGAEAIPHIGVCIDLSRNDETQQNLNQKCMELASSLAEREGAQLHVISAWDPFITKRTNRFMPPDEVAEYLTQLRDPLRKELSDFVQSFTSRRRETSIHLERGQADEVIPELAQSLDIRLLVMGNLARTGIAGYFIGNTAERIIQRISCDLLTLKADGFVSPVK